MPPVTGRQHAIARPEIHSPSQISWEFDSLYKESMIVSRRNEDVEEGHPDDAHRAWTGALADAMKTTASSIVRFMCLSLVG